MMIRISSQGGKVVRAQMTVVGAQMTLDHSRSGFSRGQRRIAQFIPSTPASLDRGRRRSSIAAVRSATGGTTPRKIVVVVGVSRTTGNVANTASAVRREADGGAGAAAARDDGAEGGGGGAALLWVGDVDGGGVGTMVGVGTSVGGLHGGMVDGGHVLQDKGGLHFCHLFPAPIAARVIGRGRDAILAIVAAALSVGATWRIIHLALLARFKASMDVVYL